MDKKNYKKGYALLFSIVVSSALITLGLSLFNLSLKEIIISTSEKESQNAYYAGYSAFECARYWNSRTKVDGTAYFPPYYLSPDPVTGWDYQSTTTNITCNGMNLAINFTCVSATKKCTGTTNFYYATGTPSSIFEPNATLFIDRSVNAGNALITILTLSGHNSGVIGKRLERVMVRQI